MEKREPSYIVGGNLNWCSHYGKQYGISLSKVKIKLSSYPAILLLGIYMEKIIIKENTFTLMFIIALFTINKI